MGAQLIPILLYTKLNLTHKTFMHLSLGSQNVFSLEGALKNSLECTKRKLVYKAK
jgi:hypothetical protein